MALSAVSYLNETLASFITVLTRLLMPSSGPGSGKFMGAIVFSADSSTGLGDAGCREARQGGKGRKR
jgi:hypothetical protein